MAKRARRSILIAITGALVLWAGTARALDPRCWPQHFVNGSGCIVVLKLGKPYIDKADKGWEKVKGEVVKRLKRRVTLVDAPGYNAPRPKGPVTIILSTSDAEGQVREFRKKLSANGEALLFHDFPHHKRDRVPMLHFGDTWYSLVPVDGEPHVFDLGTRDKYMESCWSGGTDMLRKAVGLVQHSAAGLPMRLDVSWVTDRASLQDARLAKIEGKVTDLRLVDLAFQGKPSLYVACDSGDRIFSRPPKGKRLVEETATRRLTAKSLVNAWADFNSDALLDLASWDGKILNLYLQGSRGAFGAAIRAQGVPKGRCLGLAVLGTGEPGKPGLLWSGEKGPILLKPGKVGSFTAAPLDLGSLDPVKLGDPNKCLVADFNDDGLPDVIWPCSKGAAFFEGTARGRFAEAIRCEVAMGRSPGRAFTGDWDMDGRLDIFCVAADGCRLWQNRPGKKLGKLEFRNVNLGSGEVAHVAKRTGLFGNTCDINHDGGQDLFLGCANLKPLIFRNRGFRSFVHASDSYRDMVKIFEEVQEYGHQQGMLRDVDHDGAEDMVIVLNNGDLCVLPQVDRREPSGVRAYLPGGCDVIGPVKVTAWVEDRCLGAWNVLPGTDEGFFCAANHDEMKLEWRLPGEAKARQKIIKFDPSGQKIELVRLALAPGNPASAPATAPESVPPERRPKTRLPLEVKRAPDRTLLYVITGALAGIVLVVILFLVRRKKR